MTTAHLDMMRAHVEKLLAALRARNYSGAALNAARMMAGVVIVWHNGPPDCPRRRAEWDAARVPVLDLLRECAWELCGWTLAPGRRGAAVSTAWIREAVGLAAAVLKHDGPGGANPVGPAVAPPPGGSTAGEVLAG